MRSLVEETTTVCLLDDDPSALKATSRLVSSAGWKVEHFTDPHLFLNYASHYLPRVAIIDVCMPIMDGLRVQDELRLVSPFTRVIFFTGKDDPHARARGFAGGASAFILKDHCNDELLAQIQSAISRN